MNKYLVRSFVFLIVAILFTISCSRSESEQKNMISVNENQSGIFFTKAFSMTFDKYRAGFLRVNPYQHGFMVWRQVNNLAHLTILDFEGNIVEGDIEIGLDIQVPDKLSSIACYFDGETGEIYNLGFPFVKRFDPKNRTASVVEKINTKSSRFSAYKYPFFSGYYNGPQSYWFLPIFDMVTEAEQENVIYGVLKSDRDFSSPEVLMQFILPSSGRVRKKGEKFEKEVEYYLEKTDYFPFSIDPARNRFFVIPDIWSPNIYSIGFSGKKRIFEFDFDRKPLSKFSKEDCDLWFRHVTESITNPLFVFKKKDYDSVPYFSNIFAYKDYLLVLTETYKEASKEKALYVFDADTMQCLGMTYFPVKGVYQYSFNFKDFIVCVSYILEDDEIKNLLEVFRIENSVIK